MSPTVLQTTVTMSPTVLQTIDTQAPSAQAWSCAFGGLDYSEAKAQSPKRNQEWDR